MHFLHPQPTHAALTIHWKNAIDMGHIVYTEQGGGASPVAVLEAGRARARSCVS
jgi:hypothetical protein